MAVTLIRYNDTYSSLPVLGIDGLTELSANGGAVTAAVAEGVPLAEAMRIFADGDINARLIVRGTPHIDDSGLSAAMLNTPVMDSPIQVAAAASAPKPMKAMGFFGSMFTGKAKNSSAATAERCAPILDDEACSAADMPEELEAAVGQLDEGFTEMLLRKIDESGMSDAQCYKKANVDRKLFSKIRSDMNYRPRKTTVVAFAVALELDIDETRDMLSKAGFSLTHSNRFDIIVEYFIKNGIYDVFRINEALFAYDQSLIGA